MLDKTQITLQYITRDNELDADFIKARRLRQAKAFETALQTHVEAISARFMRQMGKYTMRLITPVYLDYFDATHKTSLRHEYFDRLREQEIQQVRESIFTD